MLIRTKFSKGRVKIIQGLNRHKTKTSIYRGVTIIDNDSIRIFFLKRLYGAVRRGRVTVRLLVISISVALLIAVIIYVSFKLLY